MTFSSVLLLVVFPLFSVAEDCSLFLEPTACMRDKNCFWCGLNKPLFGELQCLVRPLNGSCNSVNGCNTKFCDQVEGILEKRDSFYTKQECIVHNDNCSFRAWENFVYGWCYQERSGGWDCACIAERTSDSNCKESFFEVWKNWCFGLVVPTGVFWSCLFFMGIPELVIDFRRLSLVDSTIESLCRLLLHVVVTLRFVWLGMFTNSCHAHEPRGDNISNAFATMSTVLFVVVVTLFPVHWMKLINTATQSSLNPVAAILIWTISFGSAIGYLGLGVVFTCLQYTNYYLHHQEHHPLYFERLLLVVFVDFMVYSGNPRGGRIGLGFCFFFFPLRWWVVFESST
eukprot:TRINITY_DN4956_c0_g2_i14.p1 TRINITY_DN4956_c0_g2~~TRINITY_DN4956_c0_g2_i14.p1  ORF type:complete len:342 (+),score=40.05 TRINITY_DN4956_c0_g2_i14:108-1133(+)